MTILGVTDYGMMYSFYIVDFDGNEIELYIDVFGVDWEDFEFWVKFVLCLLVL